MLSNLKSKLFNFKKDTISKIAINTNRNHWKSHQKGIRRAKKRGHVSYLEYFTFERNYRLIKLLSCTLYTDNKKGS